MGNATTKTAAKRTKKSFQPPVVVESAPAAPALIAIKGFDTNLVCNPIGVPFQFEIGKTYTRTGSVKACKAGFHAVEYPLDVFSYYAPADSRYAEVVLSGELSRHGNDTKVAAASITISAELRVPDLIQRAIKWVIDRCTPANAQHATGYQSASSATGDRSASLNTGNDGSSEVLDGERQSFGVAIASGFNSKARAAAGSALVVVFRNDDGSLRHIKAVIAGTDDVKPDTWYALSVDGELIEAQ